ncbi:hypothetical protein MMC07_001677 [Pseudocyphellaria aurata]|nr:hypothetical protein [Pseudocyphellaria aurata]
MFKDTPTYTHIHACQYPNSGIFGESTLLCWLEKYTFPLESSLYDPSKAKNVYSRCVAATLRHGTTTAAYYATRDAPSTNILAKICLEAGQRAFIGRCNMDSESNPETYRDASSTAAIKDTQKTITEIKRMDPDRTLICPIITPRYAPSCTSTLLAALGTLAHKESLPIQTHISENPDEIALVAKLFPDYDSYAAVYDGHRLLTPRTVLGHGVHLSPAERALIKQKGAKISHCPVSNSCISSGLCPVRQLLDEGIEVGLGTDVSGGYSPSVLAAAREAAIVSRLLSSVQRDSKPSKKPHHITSDLPDNPFSKIPPVPEPSPLHKTNEDHQRTRLTVEECLHLATVGGARCLGLEHKIGAFEVGMEWDAQLVHLSSTSLTEEPSTTTGADHDEDNPATLWGRENWSEKMAKWMFCGDDRNTRSVWVRGRLVHQRD